MNILKDETDRYEEVLTSVPAYGDFSPGKQYVGKFMDMSGATASRSTGLKGPVGMPDPVVVTTVLDCGCATGQGGVALSEKGFAVTLVDITNAGLVDEAKGLPFAQCSLWHPLTQEVTAEYWKHKAGGPDTVTARRPLSADYCYCCDVMEHLPPQFTMLAVQRMLDAAREGVFLSIAHGPDNFGVWVNKHLHQTVQPFTWWRDNLKEIATVVECIDLGNVGLFYVTK